MPNKDYYQTLGVSKTANAEEVKKAFRKLAHEHHPDKGGDAEKFKEINEAYQVLGNEQKRQQYDQFGSSFQNGQAGGAGGFNWGNFSGGQAGNVDFEDLSEMFGGLGDMFGFSSRRSGSQRPARGHDLEMALEIGFLEAVFGVEKEINYKKVSACAKCHGAGYEPGSKVEICQTCRGTGRVTKIQRTILGAMQVESVCSACQGEGKIYSQSCSACSGEGLVRETAQLKVRIPAGIDTGESIRLAGQGDAGQKGASSGDLFLHIRITPHKKFIRAGSDIRTSETINIKQAILGDKIEVGTVDGLVKLKIPEGTQSHTIFKLREKGVTKLHGHGRGDQLVEVVVKIPKNLNRVNRQNIENLKL